MTAGGTGDDRLSKNQRRDAAREKARQLRENQKKKERRGRVALQGGLILVALGIVTVVALVIINSIRPPSPGPLNMASDGIVVEEGFVAQSTPRIEAGDEPVETTRSEDDPIAITVYQDYQCPFCRDFEVANADQIATLVERDIATIEYKPVAILDRASSGTRYSTRSANAAACVANYSPDSFYVFNQILYQNQPGEETEGLTDDELISLTEEADVSSASDIAQCVQDEQFANWVADATSRAAEIPLLQNEDGNFGTPRILVNGEVYTGDADDATAFAQFVASADSEAFTEENASPSPSPSPSS